MATVHKFTGVTVPKLLANCLMELHGNSWGRDCSSNHVNTVKIGKDYIEGMLVSNDKDETVDFKLKDELLFIRCGSDVGFFKYIRLIVKDLDLDDDIITFELKQKAILPPITAHSC